MLRSVFTSILMSKPKVIVIAGTTGVGKSQLSIQLAKHVNGEIINSDSMQVYKNIPIITNKHPLEEREGIPHHVMNHVNWTEEYYLHRFEKECLASINEIHQKGKIPIIVGGTHYYLQMLFDKRIANKNREPTEEENKILNSDDPDLIYDTLAKHDPTIAGKFHPNDTRRVRRMLEIIYTTGENPSKAYAEQKPALKFDTLFFWIYSSPEQLDRRLDDRVDNMLKSGGMEEIQQLYHYYRTHNFTSEQCENGVWQVIGFKEFLPWLESDANSSLEQSVERMKVRTRQYAKKQVKWIKKMLIPDINGNIYLLNATDLTQWTENVFTRAISIVDAFIKDEPIEEIHAEPELSSLLIFNPHSQNLKDSESWKHFTCSICRDQNDKCLIAIGESNWQIHLKSRRHKSNIGRLRKKENFDKWQKKRNGNMNEGITH
ncbi:LAFE_0E05952g1_1 [Lachancea fermentati]|uniref:tRNA dimethylallyltransferase n=1 Tax=Lachancea fermentati TaxID=4955 RepID=A0A1G4MDE4_LACFM|nr:LAFE_0E05952g1_1 [Lachancea fermentati]